MPELPAHLAEAWSAWLDGAADEAAVAELLGWLDAHRDGIAPLRAEAGLHLALGYRLAAPNASLRQAVLSRIANRAPGESSGGFAIRAMARVRRRPRARRRALAWPWAAAAACAATLAAAIWLGSATTHPEPPASVPTPIAAKPQAPNATAAAVLTVRSGNVSVDGTPIHAERPIDGEATIEVAAESAADLRLADGSAFALESSSRLAHRSTDVTWRLESGAIAVDAAPQQPRHQLAIATPRATVRVVGTAFRIEADAERTWVADQRGHVAVAAGGAERLLEPGQEALADAAGLAPALDAARRRVLAPGDGAVSQWFDRVDFAPIAGSFHGLPLARFAYRRDPAKQATFGDVEWPVHFADDERRVELWFRASAVEPMPGADATAVAITVGLEHTDYLVAEQPIRPDERGWFHLVGDLDHAGLNWCEEGRQPEPLRPAAIRTVSFRAYRGHISGELTAPIVVRNP